MEVDMKAIFSLLEPCHDKKTTFKCFGFTNKKSSEHFTINNPALLYSVYQDLSSKYRTLLFKTDITKDVNFVDRSFPFCDLVEEKNDAQ